MEPVRSGLCEECGRAARGGTRRNWGPDQVLLCPKCGRKKEEAEVYLTQSQAKALLKAAGELSRRHELLVFIGLNLGLRISEIVALQLEDFEWDEGRVLVTSQKRKGHPRLPVQMSQELQAALYGLVRALIEREKRETAPRPLAVGPLFRRRRGGHDFKRDKGSVSRWSGMKMFREARAAAGLPKRTSSHSMRHYCAVQTLEHAEDLHFASKQLRHAHLATTERYLHLLPERAARLAALIPVTKAKSR